MSDFDLDLRAVEERIETDAAFEGGVVLDVLDGSTPPDERLEAVEDGNVLVLYIDGDVNELAAGFSRDAREAGASLVHFRGFLVVAPPGVDVDTSRL